MTWRHSGAVRYSSGGAGFSAKYWRMAWSCSPSRRPRKRACDALVEGSAEGKGSIAGVGFTAVHEVVEARSGASGEDFHRAVVDHEEVMAVLRKGSEERAELALGLGRMRRREVDREVDHATSRTGLLVRPRRPRGLGLGRRQDPHRG